MKLSRLCFGVLVFGLAAFLMSGCEAAPKRTSSTAHSSERKQAADPIYFARPTDSPPSEVARPDQTIAEVRAIVPFPVAEPTETLGKARDRLFVWDGDGPSRPKIVVMEYDGLLITQRPAVDDLLASAAMTGGFDDRFMKRVSVRGNAGIAWDPVDVTPTTAASGSDRPGVRTFLAHIVWTEDGVTYNISGGKKWSDLLRVAESHRRP